MSLKHKKKRATDAEKALLKMVFSPVKISLGRYCYR
jgi:hypothetical protein